MSSSPTTTPQMPKRWQLSIGPAGWFDIVLVAVGVLATTWTLASGPGPLSYQAPRCTPTRSSNCTVAITTTVSEISPATSAHEESVTTSSRVSFSLPEGSSLVGTLRQGEHLTVVTYNNDVVGVVHDGSAVPVNGGGPAPFGMLLVFGGLYHSVWRRKANVSPMARRLGKSADNPAPVGGPGLRRSKSKRSVTR